VVSWRQRRASRRWLAAAEARVCDGGEEVAHVCDWEINITIDEKKFLIFFLICFSMIS
jgi:hypothetical protein